MNSDIVVKQEEIIERLVELNKALTLLLSQYTAVDEYEKQLNTIMREDICLSRR